MMKFFKRFKAYWGNAFTPKLVEVLQTGYSWALFRRDCFAALTTTIVSLPFSIVLGIACGVSPAQGLYTAVVASFWVSLLGGSRFQIAGPNEVFIIVILNTLGAYGYNGLVMTMLIASVLAIVAGLLRLGAYVRFIPYPVIIGFTAGMGVLLLSTQVKDLLGLPLTNIPTDFLDKWQVYWTHLNTMNLMTVTLALGTFAVILAVERYFPKMPAMLFGIMTSALCVACCPFPVATIGTQFGTLPHFLPQPVAPDFSVSLFLKMIPSGLTIAFLVAIKSLLSAKIIDGMSGDHHNPNATLMAQGVANMACAFFAGIPATGAIARSATNFKAHAYSPISGIMQAVFLLLCMLLLSGVMPYIPLTSLAVVLAMVAWNMLSFDKIYLMLKSPIGADKLILLATIFLTILVDLNTAIATGFIASCILFMYRMSHEFEIAMDESTEYETTVGMEEMKAALKAQGVIILRVGGPLFFGDVSEITSFLKKQTLRAKVLILRLNQMTLLDASGSTLILDLIQNLQRQGGKVILCNIRKQPRHLLHVACTQKGIHWKTLSVAKNYTNALKMAQHLLKKQ